MIKLMSKKYDFDCGIDFLCCFFVVVAVIIWKLIDILRGKLVSKRKRGTRDIMFRQCSLNREKGNENQERLQPGKSIYVLVRCN